MTDLTSPGAALDLVWWITGVELPMLAGLFWLGWRTVRDMDHAIDTLSREMEVGLGRMGRELDAYKLDVAKSYASIAYIKDVEQRLTEHLIRIEEKLDAASRGGANQ